MSAKQTLKTNTRDILAFLLIGLVCSILGDLAIKYSSSTALPGLAGFIALLHGFARFVGANACLWLLGIAIAWPTLDAFSNDSFTDCWNKITDPFRRMCLFVAVCGFEGIMAAICFSN